MATRWKAPFFLLRFFIFTFLASLTPIESAPAQVVTDGSLGGPKGLVPGDGTTTYLISDSLGNRPKQGQNLFHSFSSFNVWAGESATFTSASNGIRNVVSRVTGGDPSIINGALRSTIQGANLGLGPSGRPACLAERPAL